MNFQVFSRFFFLLAYAFLLKRQNEDSDPMEESKTDDAVHASELLPKETSGPVALSVGRAK